MVKRVRNLDNERLNIHESNVLPTSPGGPDGPRFSFLPGRSWTSWWTMWSYKKVDINLDLIKSVHLVLKRLFFWLSGVTLVVALVF